jgi:hypothetical protein
VEVGEDEGATPGGMDGQGRSLSPLRYLSPSPQDPQVQRFLAEGDFVSSN